jgi:hypothetical protein
LLTAVGAGQQNVAGPGDGGAGQQRDAVLAAGAARRGGINGATVDDGTVRDLQRQPVAQPTRLVDVAASGAEVAVDLLQGDDVGVRALDHSGGAVQVEDTVEPDPVVNVEGQHAHGPRTVPQNRRIAGRQDGSGDVQVVVGHGWFLRNGCERDTDVLVAPGERPPTTGEPGVHTTCTRGAHDM